MEKLITESLSNTAPDSDKVYTPPGATEMEKALCRAVHFYLSPLRTKLEAILWHDDDASRFLQHLLELEFETTDLAKMGVKNPEAIAVFDSMVRAFAFPSNITTISVHPRFLTLTSSFAVIALTFDSYERINSHEANAILSHALVALLNIIRHDLQNDNHISHKFGAYYYGNLQLPLWLVKKYHVPRTNKPH